MTTTDTNAPEEKHRGWRGVAAEDRDEIPDKVSLVLRDRSRRLMGQLLRPHKRIIGVALAAVLVENAARLAVPYLVKEGIDSGIPPILAGAGKHTLWVIVGWLLVAVVVQAVTRQLFLQLAGVAGERVLVGLRRRMFAHFHTLSPAFHESYTAGRVISRQTSDMDAINEMLEGGFDGLITALLTLVGTAVLLLVLDVKLGLVALLCLPFLWLLTRWFRRASAKAYRRTRETVALVIVHFVETINGMRAVQAFRREDRNQEIFDAVNDDYRAANERAFRLVGTFMPGIKLLGNVTVAVVLIYGAHLAFDGEVTVGVLAAFLLYLRQFFEPMQEISQFYNTFQSASAALEKLSGVLEERASVPEPEHPTRLREPHGAVAFSDVAFEYVEGRSVIPALDLEIPAGQTVALVGTTGAGKTTLAKLVSRFYDPTRGDVTLDGVDLRRLSEADLRRAVVMVTQENYLFNGSVADNIAFGKPNASIEEITAAAKAIGAHEFIAHLPEGYDTDVANRGGRLSAGQRQLVAFVRAFLADPAVLILDEATSSLDVPSERLVQRALRTILAERTAIIIAHRLSTVEIADRVLVMEHGRLVEDGTPAELIAADGGRYSDLHTAWVASLA
ncbi:MAG: ABC transporter ATP-binding protein [Nocardioidaceae bacterium]